MTFEEARNLLIDMRAAKRRANAIKARIADLESDCESIRSALNGGMPHGNEFYSRVEMLAIQIQSETERHTRALEAFFILEDRLAAAIDSLEPLERDVVLGCYLDGKPIWKVAEEVNYSERNVKYIKSRAIRKIAKFL